jgi:uncharacterized protein YbjT (DUF2867 family)
MPRTALLAGATGLVGRHCLTQLLAATEYTKVKVLARRPLTHEEGKLEVIRTDLSYRRSVHRRVRRRSTRA